MAELNEVRMTGVVDGSVTKGKYGAKFNFIVPETYVNSLGDSITNKVLVPVNTYEDSDVELDLVKVGARLTIEGRLRSFRIEDETSGRSYVTVTILATKITKV